MPAWRGCDASRELPVCIGAICSGASSMGEALCWPRFRATHPFAFFASLRSAVRHRRARNLSLSSTSVQTRAFLNLKASKVSTRAFLHLKASKTSLAPPPRFLCVLSVPAVCRCGAGLGGPSTAAGGLPDLSSLPIGGYRVHMSLRGSRVPAVLAGGAAAASYRCRQQRCPGAFAPSLPPLPLPLPCGRRRAFLGN